MQRPLVLAFVLALTSCRSYQKVDPIYGRQTIPPQRTGAIGALTSRDTAPPPPGYYDTPGNRPAGAPPAPGDNFSPPGNNFDFRGGAGQKTPASGASTSGDSRWNPPGSSSAPGRAVSSGDDRSRGFGQPGMQPTGPDDANWPSRYENRSSPPAPSRYDPPASPSSGFNGSGSASTNGGMPVQTSSWNYARDSGTSADYVTRTGPSEVRDIMDLPGRGELHRGEAAAPRAEDNGFRGVQPARFDGPPEAGNTGISASVVTSNSTDVRQYYDHDADYRWLKGRLDYSPVSRRWKLRYIPISGNTDRFGGSVILQDTPQLSGLNSGDFVAVEGQLQGDGSPSGGFAPLFRPDRITRLR
jgi:hypothetical protein